jgi:hypothetical protein
LSSIFQGCASCDAYGDQASTISFGRSAITALGAPQQPKLGEIYRRHGPVWQKPIAMSTII